MIQIQAKHNPTLSHVHFWVQWLTLKIDVEWKNTCSIWYLSAAIASAGNVASIREPVDGSLWWYWIAGNAVKKNGACFKNYHCLSYLFYLISHRSFTILHGLWSMSYIVSCFGLRVDISPLDGVLCNSCQTPLLKYWISGKKSLHVCCDRVQNFYTWELNKLLQKNSKC